ncbi:hypothetical protein ACH3VR_22680 [Microbacterium sp. B2969]|uniref:DUF4333 domain-containing protein n=1 Tax=Microbacterium alkaliflavum TaxID=3248839 RepID=A0ABW7QEB8_9MICO
MGNLGGYQWITTFIKSVGGPAKAARYAVGAAGLIFVAGGAAYAGGEQAVKVLKSRLEKRAVPCATQGQTFTVAAAADADAGGGLTLRAGDAIRVLECDDDAIVVEVIGDENNPYVVSGQLLTSISDFPGGEPV